jgi:transposase
MTSTLSVAARFSSETRKHFAIHALAGSEPISHVAEREQVSRKFIYHQKHKAEAALDQAFSPSSESSEVLF